MPVSAPLIERRTHPNHIGSHIKNDGGLPPVGGTAVDFRSLLSISTAKQKSDRRSEFALSILFGDFNIRSVELSVAVWLDDTEQVTDDLLLPVQKQKRFSSPCTFGVTQALDEVHGKICKLLIIHRVLCLEPGRLIFFLLHIVTSKWHKK